MMTFNSIFITVGTTKFPELIDCIKQPLVGKIIKDQLKCKHLIIQAGSSGAGAAGDPDDEQKYNSSNGFNDLYCDIHLQVYDFKQSIADDIRGADLIISHAGAGTCMEVLNAKKPLIVVVNDRLMDNHQSELAKQLSQDEYVFCCTPNKLPALLEKLDVTQLKSYTPGNTKELLEYIDSVMGVSKCWP